VILRDEQGKDSLSRHLLVATVVFTFGVVVADLVLPGTAIGSAVYSLLGTFGTVFAAWAAGPRIAQYIGPAIGQIAGGIAAGRHTRKHGINTEPYDDVR
jgi:hypothetical protein